MTSIFEITDWAHVASFFIWTLAVCALAKALFGSLLLAELQYRPSLRDAPRRQWITRLNWEVNNRTKWSEDVARLPTHGTQTSASPHAAAIPLTESEVQTKHAELQRLSQRSLPWRALQYLLGCWACQNFWTAIIIYALTHCVTDPASWLFSAAAYSGAAVLLSALYTSGQPQPTAPSSRRSACKNCGK